MTIGVNLKDSPMQFTFPHSFKIFKVLQFCLLRDEAVLLVLGHILVSLDISKRITAVPLESF